MDNLDSLFNKKEYQLVLDLTKDSKDPKELLMRISCFVILGKTDEALDEIEKNQSLIETKYQLRLMKLHFELFLSKKLFDEARIALKHYENLPYVSQEVEEFMREMKDRIEEESHPNSPQKFEIDDIYDVLEKETDSGKISQVLFSLKNYNLNIYIDSLKIFLVREDVNPNFRTYGLLLLVDEKYDKEIKFRNLKEIISVVPSRLEPPFTSFLYPLVCGAITSESNNDVSLTKTALHLFNCYIIDSYPDSVFEIEIEDLSKAFVVIAKEYLGQDTSSYDEKVLNLAKEIKEKIESVPEIRL
ncbi:MAG: hypothetical protein MJ222_00745 [Bacilli bacterium]|nr:hypothetical protein [Bacilli bacterium]